LNNKTTDIKSNEGLFRDYLYKEYSYIAEAHFKTIETISTFFKHYLALMTIPIILITYLFATASKNVQIIEMINTLKLPGAILLIVIASAGCAVMLYIINLRLDALLYARTVNGIRKYFYDLSGIDTNIKLRMRTLPQTTSQPAYYETYYFLPVIFAFALLNSVYILAGSFILTNQFAPSFISSLIFFLMHIVFYRAYALHREAGYLKSNIIGIDIDGVLNKHRDHFCKLIKEKTMKDISPKEITHIPVHELGKTTLEEDNAVFNDPRYWVEMPLEDDSSKNMKKLRNIFKLKVFIFTYRGWPDVKQFSNEEKIEVLSNWRTTLVDYEKCVSTTLSKSAMGLNYHKLRNRFRKNKNIINRITKLWLENNNIEYNRLIIEKGNENTTDPRGLFYNRFNFSRKKRIKYFVEDDLEKAIKLAFLCDIVFLMDHPYNKFEAFSDMTIPPNIIRVKSWNDIYRNIRKLS